MTRARVIQRIQDGMGEIAQPIVDAIDLVRPLQCGVIRLFVPLDPTVAVLERVNRGEIEVGNTRTCQGRQRALAGRGAC